jgi:hypothetical protein
LIRKPQSPLEFLPLFFVVLSLLLSQSASGQFRIYQNGQPTLTGTEAPLNIDSPSRRKIDLSGVWSYSTDDETWKDARMPSSFDYEGRVVFLRKFAVDRATLKSSALQLVAFGINYDAEVYVNDVFVGKHVGGYTTIQFELPENSLQLGSENVIRIVVKNDLGARSTIPLRKQIWGWRNYGGILRDIYLLVTPKLWIDQLSVRTALDESLARGEVRVTATLASKPAEAAGDRLNALLPSGQANVAVELLDRSSGALVGQTAPQPVSVLPSREYEIQASLPVASPKLWSPDHPDLYVVRARLFVQQDGQVRLIDQFDRMTGFSRVEVKGTSFVVNGEPVTLNGVVWHEDSPDHGATLTYEQMEKDIVLIKSLGANAIRFGFHPPHPYVIRLCSRYGLFALEEIPVWNAPGEVLAQESFQDLAAGMMEEMVARDAHQPCVLAWGLGHEFDSADPRARGYVQQLVAAAKKLDTRPVYYGTRTVSGDVCSDLVAVAGLSMPAEDVESFKTYPEDVKSFKNELLRWKRRVKNQPVLLLGYGKEVAQNNRNGWSDPLSQEAQAKYFERFYAAIKEAKIAGSFIESFADWRGDRPLLTAQTGNRYVHPVGLVPYSREKRVSYETVRALYNGEKITALPIGRYRASFPVVHILWGFAVIFVVAYLYHYNRRFNESFRRALVRPFNFYSDLRDVRSVSIPQTTALALAVAVTLGVVVSGILYRYRTDSFADYILTQIVVWDAIKERLISATWKPFEGIIAFSIVFLAFYPVAAALIKLFSFLVRSRVYWYHAFAVAVWGSLPIVLLSPLGMALFKLLQSNLYAIPTFVLIAAFLLWSFFRILKGVSVIYDISPLKAYIGGILLTLVGGAGVFIYYESAYAITAYAKLAYHLARSLG